MMFWDTIALGGYLLLNAIISRVTLGAERKGTAPPRWIRPVIILSIPWAISIHTVTAFLYAGLSARPFWMTAVLFASEHGPYWDVGLAAGIIYNWWMVRTKSLGDCILAHAVTNGALCIYVVATRHWEYWP